MPIAGESGHIADVLGCRELNGDSIDEDNILAIRQTRHGRNTSLRTWFFPLFGCHVDPTLRHPTQLVTYAKGGAGTGVNDLLWPVLVYSR